MEQPKTAFDYWTLITPVLEQNATGSALNEQVCAILTPALDTEELIKEIINFPFPTSLGLVDSTEYDTTCANIIKGLHKVIQANGLTPKPLPANAPTAGATARHGSLSWIAGGSSRAQVTADLGYQAEREKARKESSNLDSTGGCRGALAAHYSSNPKEADPKAWKRTGKFTQSGKIFRTFTCKATGKEATAIFDPSLDDEPEEAIWIEDGTIAPSGSPATFPKVYGKYRSGRVHFSINAVDDTISFYCGPETEEGRIDDLDDQGVVKVLENIFKDQDIEIAAAENYHMIKPKPGQSMADLKQLVLDRGTAAGATICTINDMDM